MKAGSAAFSAVWVVGDFTLFLQFFDVLVDTQFGNGANSVGAHLERHPFVGFGDEKLLGVEIRVEATARLAVGVGNVVPRDRFFARQVTDSGHGKRFKCSS
jgi:hypothetical protein